MENDTALKPYKDYVGVFDSGLGGISVLKALVKELPHENFWYFGDSAYTPYGEKETEKVQQLSLRIADRMVAEGVKAIVIACNTATSVAADVIRDKYQEKIPIIGVEPAIKLAADAMEEQKSRILVMATPMTLGLDKFQKLEERLSRKAEFLMLPCPGLAGRIEYGDPEGQDLLDMLHGFLDPYRGKVDSVVLGCTHYPFVRKQISRVIGEDIPMFDGGEGTARELRRMLTERGTLQDKGNGKVVFESSLKGQEVLERYAQFFKGDQTE